MASKLSTTKQLTLALIKPDILPLNYKSSTKRDQILSLIKQNRFEVMKSKELTLSKEQAEAFYNEHRGKFFYQRLVSFMTRFLSKILQID
jgi:nucleoside-diphosphate kinase